MQSDSSVLSEQWRQACSGVDIAHVIVEYDGTAILTQQFGAPESATAYSGASMIKTMLAELVTADVVAGIRQWSDPVAVTLEHAVAEDGVLKAWDLPASLTLGNLQQLMVAISDNTATNTVIDLLGGVVEVNQRLSKLGYESRVRRHVGRLDEPTIETEPDPALIARPGFSIVHPAEHLRSLQQAIKDPTTARHFASQTWQLGLARYLDSDAWFAHKTGTVSGIRHDAGVLRHHDHELAVSIFTASTERAETVDHPGLIAAAVGMQASLYWLGWDELILPGIDAGATSGPR